MSNSLRTLGKGRQQWRRMAPRLAVDSLMRGPHVFRIHKSVSQVP